MSGTAIDAGDGAPKAAARPMIVGAGGMLGRHLAEILIPDHPDTVCATRDEIDITDYFGTRWNLERLEPTVVINCAALTDVDGCEARAEEANRVNGEGAGLLSRACREVGARIIHVSTDFVFDGASERPYREDDAARPLSAYGRSKLLGERRVAEENPDHLIVRCSWLYGPYGRSFVSAILEAARAGRTPRVVTDQHGTPTYTADLGWAIRRLLDMPARGVIHFANAGVCSRLELAREALRAAGLAVPVEPIRSDELSRPARRPAYSALDTARYAALAGEPPRPWQETLADYVAATAAG